MNRLATSDSRFSYTCNQCGRCCRDQVITLAPYDLIRIARVAGITTGDAIGQFTRRRGSILKFSDDGACVALDDSRCTLHQGRPLACRLYPLGLERDAAGAESFVRLDPAPGSLGIYGENGVIADFLAAQGVAPHLDAINSYRRLLPLLRERIATLADFAIVEPREFWRVAIREALAETEYDPNPLIDALFDSDALGCYRDSLEATVDAHVRALADLIDAMADPAILAAAAVMIAVSLGYSPAAAIA